MEQKTKILTNIGIVLLILVVVCLCGCTHPNDYDKDYNDSIVNNEVHEISFSDRHCNLSEYSTPILIAENGYSTTNNKMIYWRNGDYRHPDEINTGVYDLCTGKNYNTTREYTMFGDMGFYYVSSVNVYDLYAHDFDTDEDILIFEGNKFEGKIDMEGKYVAYTVCNHMNTLLRDGDDVCVDSDVYVYNFDSKTSDNIGNVGDNEGSPRIDGKKVAYYLCKHENYEFTTDYTDSNCKDADIGIYDLETRDREIIEKEGYQLRHDIDNDKIIWIEPNKAGFFDYSNVYLYYLGGGRTVALTEHNMQNKGRVTNAFITDDTVVLEVRNMIGFRDIILYNITTGERKRLELPRTRTDYIHSTHARDGIITYTRFNGSAHICALSIDYCTLPSLSLDDSSLT